METCDGCERTIGEGERYARFVEFAHEDSVVCLDCLLPDQPTILTHCRRTAEWNVRIDHGPDHGMCQECLDACLASIHPLGIQDVGYGLLKHKDRRCEHLYAIPEPGRDWRPPGND